MKKILICLLGFNVLPSFALDKSVVVSFKNSTNYEIPYEMVIRERFKALTIPGHGYQPYHQHYKDVSFDADDSILPNQIWQFAGKFKDDADLFSELEWLNHGGRPGIEDTTVILQTKEGKKQRLNLNEGPGAKLVLEAYAADEGPIETRDYVELSTLYVECQTPETCITEK